MAHAMTAPPIIIKILEQLSLLYSTIESTVSFSLANVKIFIGSRITKPINVIFQVLDCSLGELFNHAISPGRACGFC